MPNSQTVLAAIALLILGLLGAGLLFHTVPPDNRIILNGIASGIGGALTMGGVQKVVAGSSANDATTKSGDGAS